MHRLRKAGLRRKQKHLPLGIRFAIVVLLFTVAPAFAGSGSAIKVVMMGDSTTLSKRSPKGNKLTDCVQRELERIKKPYKFEVINKGVGGQTADGGLKRLERDAIALNPAAITISFGLNDTGKLTPEKFREAVESMLKLLKQKSKAWVILVTSTPFNNKQHAWAAKFENKGGLDQHMDKNYCSAMRELARKYNVGLCDLHEEFNKAFKQKPSLLAEIIRRDGVHLTEKGNEMAARFLAHTIISELSGKRK